MKKTAQRRRNNAEIEEKLSTVDSENFSTFLNFTGGLYREVVHEFYSCNHRQNYNILLQRVCDSLVSPESVFDVVI